MRFLVFKHIECEHPGKFRTYLDESGVIWDSVELDKGEKIPNLEKYDALWVMGGPMNVWEEEKYPWLIDEKKSIRKWVEDIKRPYLGICLGHQLLADSLGGRCGIQNPPEIGIFKIELTKKGINDPIFKGMEKNQFCLQWHSVQVKEPPKNSVILASSQNCEVQAMKVGEYAWSMQYHVEVENDTVENWSKIPEYYLALERSIGKESIDILTQSSLELMPNFNNNCKKLFINFYAAVQQISEKHHLTKKIF
tara:strand:- start:102 stop:854 length:753 start_codon:yes stop_codon:yes gene_type:complete